MAQPTKSQHSFICLHLSILGNQTKTKRNVKKTKQVRINNVPVWLPIKFRKLHPTDPNTTTQLAKLSWLLHWWETKSIRKQPTKNPNISSFIFFPLSFLGKQTGRRRSKEEGELPGLGKASPLTSFGENVKVLLMKQRLRHWCHPHSIAE